jgi:pyruvate dehydrogenase E2 component (dihydrolipoamide acetyltransferase)
MHASLQNSAQLTHHMSADARKIMDARKKVKEKQKEGASPNITLNDMICYSTIRALKQHPLANAHLLNGEVSREFRKVHLGFAVDTPRGLMVPCLKNADDLSLEGLSNQLASLAEKCRSGSIDPDLLSSQAASFTISNLGNYGVEMFTPVINLPQVGILGVNTIVNRPADLGNGVFGFIPHVGLSLTYDHRALDGGPATLLLREIKNEIEDFDY